MYKKLPLFGYLQWVQSYRRYIVAFYLFLALLGALYTKDGFVYSDESLWLGGSQEYSKLLALKYPSHTTHKLTIELSDELQREDIDKLKALHKELLHMPGVVRLDTIFEQRSLYKNEITQSQSLVEITSLLEQESQSVLEALQNDSRKFANYLHGKSIDLFIIADSDFESPKLMTEYKYSYNTQKSSTRFRDIALFGILFFIIAGSFTVSFKSFLPTVLGAIFILLTTLYTVALFQAISPLEVTHISIVLLAVTVSVMDFIYLYYKWHVLQSKASPQLLLYRVFVRTFIPIMMTTFISVVGIGSLIFVDSHILQAMGLNVALSSFVGFVLSFTFLPAVLTYFKPSNSDIVTRDSSKFFARFEAHYKSLWLNLFLIISLLVAVVTIYCYTQKPLRFESEKASSGVIRLALTQEGLNTDTLLELQSTQTLLEERFSHAISGYESAYSEIERLYVQEHGVKPNDLEKIDIDAYTFMFDLYNVTDKIMTNGHLTLALYLHENVQKDEILSFIQNENILITDSQSLLRIAKKETIATLFSAAIFVIALIMLLIYFITRTYQFVLIAMLVNTLPIIWFFASLFMFGVTLSTEIFVALIITLALSSDATMHFIYHYYKQRAKPRNAEQTLETSFVYVGTPLGMGNVILILTFVSLVSVPDETINTVGLYSSVLITISLLSELFALPILYLSQIKNNRALKGYYHEK